MSPGLLLDLLADAAWPASEQRPLGPWKLRATAGVTRRANSALTAGDQRLSDADTESLIDEVETFYTARDLPPCFQISRYSVPPDLDDRLAARGYVPSAHSEVWTAPVPPAVPAAPDPALRHADAPDDAWFTCAFDEPAPRRLVHEQIVHRVPAPRLFLTALVDHHAAACAMAVSSAGHTGVFAMATRPDFRRRRLASRLLAAIQSWAASRGDHTLYLQVMTDNTPAQSLYARHGFTFSHPYHYRTR